MSATYTVMKMMDNKMPRVMAEAYSADDAWHQVKQYHLMPYPENEFLKTCRLAREEARTSATAVHRMAKTKWYVQVDL